MQIKNNNILLYLLPINKRLSKVGRVMNNDGKYYLGHTAL